MSLQSKSNSRGLGRRKTSIATLRLQPSSEAGSNTFFEVNGRSGEEYFQYNFHYLHHIQAPLRDLELVSQYSLVATVKGGGLKGQADAIKLALARALCSLDPSTFRSTLKKANHLSRDARIKERRKYGLKKARKASQYSKR